METTIHVKGRVRTETGVPLPLARGESAANSADEAISDTKLRALMLVRAAERHGSSAASIALGVALVTWVQWRGPGAWLLPTFIGLRLMLAVYNQWLARRIIALRGQADQVMELEWRFVFGMGASGATWGLIGWMVPDLDLAHWSAREVFSCLILVYTSCMMLILAAHSPRALVTHICAQWLVAIAATLMHREHMRESAILIASMLGLLITTLSYGRLLIAQTRRGVRAELQGEDLTERLRLANQGLEHALQRAVEAASHDPLTGVLNRRALYSRAEYIAAERRREDNPCAVLLLDLDHFKHVNDRHGHAAGDAVLAEMALTLSRELREVDVIARWGGEEFLVLLPSCNLASALARAEQVRARVAAMQVDALPPGYPVSVSIGVADWPMSSTLDEAINRADGALYRAKEAGRDRVALAA